MQLAYLHKDRQHCNSGIVVALERENPDGTGIEQKGRTFETADYQGKKQ
jgi:hypothetical protein